MLSERKHASTGASVEDCIRGFCAELVYDGVSSYSIWATARYGFSLSGQELEVFALRTIEALLEAGAVPALTDSNGPNYFRKLEGYIGSTTAIAEQVVKEICSLDRDPDHGSIWFYRFEPS